MPSKSLYLLRCLGFPCLTFLPLSRRRQPHRHYYDERDDAAHQYKICDVVPALKPGNLFIRQPAESSSPRLVVSRCHRLMRLPVPFAIEMRHSVNENSARLTGTKPSSKPGLGFRLRSIGLCIRATLSLAGCSTVTTLLVKARWRASKRTPSFAQSAGWARTGVGVGGVATV